MIEQVPNAFTQIDQQVAQGQPATVLVERNNGENIATAQVMGVGEGKTNVFYGDLSDGPKKGMLYKSVGNERLTDEYQAKLAEKLAGEALRGSGVEVDADTRPRSSVLEANRGSNSSKYTEAFVKENPYAHLLDPDLSDEEFKEVQDRVAGMDLRSDEQKSADLELEAAEKLRRQRTEADHRYSQARQAGADHDAAEASADRAFRDR